MPIALVFLLALAPPPKPIDAVTTWQKTEQAIKRFYYGRETHAKEMDERLARYTPLAEAAKTETEFRDVVDRMIAEFRDSHFDFLTDEDQGYYLMDDLASSHPAAMPEFGAWFQRTQEGYAVDMVLNGTEAEKAGLMKGDRILTVDGGRFTPIESIRDDIGKTVDLRIRRGSEELDKKVKISSAPALDMFLDATRDSIRIIDSGGHKYGYIHLWTQASQRFADLLSTTVYQRFKDTDGCILDLRDGFGGRPEHYADPFFLPEVKLDWKYPDSTTHAIFGYDRPLAVLIDSGTRSAKEVLSFVFETSHRAVLVGSNTAGNVLGTYPYRIAPWAYIEIPIVQVYANGIRLEDRGVAPDLPVAQEFDPSGKDLYLQAAEDRLNEEIATGAKP